MRSLSIESLHISFCLQVIRVAFFIYSFFFFFGCSNGVCQVIEAEGVIDPLIDTLRCQEVSVDLMEKVFVY